MRPRSSWRTPRPRRTCRASRRSARSPPTSSAPSPPRGSRTAATSRPSATFIADIQLAATRAANRGGAQIALMNPGGLRPDFLKREDGTVTFADAATVAARHGRARDSGPARGP
ncbi:5'-nucleotidase C-terminal domain-containing protein [Micromonospora taraxaci]